MSNRRLPMMVAACAPALVALVYRRRRGQQRLAQAHPCVLAHLLVGRSWEYEIRPGGGTAVTTVLESNRLDDGRKAYRIEYRKGEQAVDQVCTEDDLGRLVALSQSKDEVLFDPPMVAMGSLALGASWSQESSMLLQDMRTLPTPIQSSGRVVSVESVTVPAGTFAAAFRVEYLTNGNSCTSWNVPGVGMVREVTHDEELRLTRILDPVATADGCRGRWGPAAQA